MMDPLPIEISRRETAALLASDAPPLLVDCREREEHEIVAIAGGQLLPMSEFPACASELAGREGQRIVIYCHVGGRSAQVAAWLRRQGFVHAQSMAGGIDQWAIDIEPGMTRY